MRTRIRAQKHSAPVSGGPVVIDGRLTSVEGYTVYDRRGRVNEENLNYSILEIKFKAPIYLLRIYSDLLD